MSANPRIHLSDVPIEGQAGALWNRLHAEREDICELMLKDYPDSESTQLEDATPWNDVGTVNWHRALLQRRIQKIDDALDRLMSGSYGSCSRCGGCLDEIKLALDPAIAFCSACWQLEQGQMRALESSHTSGPRFDSNSKLHLMTSCDSSVADLALETVARFDTIVIRTRNSVYRALLVDPEKGRALVEGGNYLVEPKEALLSGSILRGHAFKLGWIIVGGRLEMWVDGKLMLTSPIESVHIEHHPAAESLADISRAM